MGQNVGLPFACAALCFVLPGCAGKGWAPLLTQAKPETAVEIDPLRRRIILHNSKDVTIHIKDWEGDFDINDKCGKWKVGEMTIEDNASAVRLANVKQMEMSNQILQSSYDLLKQLIQAVPVAASHSTSQTSQGKVGAPSPLGATLSQIQSANP